MPTDAHTESNCVFVHPDDADKIPGLYVEVGGMNFPFTVRPDPAVLRGTLAMNGIQRKCCGITLTTGAELPIPAGGFKKPIGVITKIKVEVEHTAATRKVGTLSVAQFVLQVRGTFAGQIFPPRSSVCRDQRFDEGQREDPLELEEISKASGSDVGQLIAERRLFL